MKRRDFIGLSLGLTGLSTGFISCADEKIKGRIVGASAEIGHRLRNNQFPPVTERIHKKIIIIGGGISGLTAAWYLQKKGETNFLLLDLEEKVGGNSASGQNEISAFPWGAHYIPIPNNDLPEYLEFLESCQVITGKNEAGLPVYNETHLCFDPQERLYINGRWQDGLVPNFGVPQKDQEEIARFLDKMDHYRKATGSDGKMAFAIPVDNSSKDEVFTQLDTITMQAWLQQNGFTSHYLHEYVNYCCRDDFGTPLHLVSAWAGIHYFASRKGAAANAEHSDVLTWPEGNGYLVKQLSKDIQPNILTRCMAVNVAPTHRGTMVTYFDVARNKMVEVEASQCIMAVPQFIASRLLASDERKRQVNTHFNYVPWMVANLTVGELEERTGAPRSWDNVLFESEALGYVEATHELLQQVIKKRNITYYLPLTQEPPMQARKNAQLKSHKDWAEMVFADLQKVHPDIRKKTEEINVQVWGHAMVQPLPGTIFNSARQMLAASIDNKIHFAHTDLAGISIFEEGFYQGLAAAKKVLTAST